MDELTKLASLLLVHNMHHLPALTCLQQPPLLIGSAYMPQMLPQCWQQ
jgi:hypothetical protein